MNLFNFSARVHISDEMGLLREFNQLSTIDGERFAVKIVLSFSWFDNEHTYFFHFFLPNISTFNDFFVSRCDFKL